MAEHENLATKDFWSDTYLTAYEVPSRPSAAIPFERCMIAELDSRAPVQRRARVVELGCAPGRWMVHYAERFDAEVEGVEYTEYGAEQTRANLEACGVDGTVHHADFWEFEPERPYDLVISQGFIEHFTDVEAAFARHLALLAPEGRLALQVPNYQGVNRVLQRWCDPDWLALHNMDAMGDGLYRRLAERHGMELEAVSYFGGFDPDLISVRRRGRKLMAPFWHARHRGFGDSVNARWLSAGLICVMRAPA